MTGAPKNPQLSHGSRTQDVHFLQIGPATPPWITSQLRPWVCTLFTTIGCVSNLTPRPYSRGRAFCQPKPTRSLASASYFAWMRPHSSYSYRAWTVWVLASGPPCHRTAGHYTPWGDAFFLVARREAVLGVDQIVGSA